VLLFTWKQTGSDVTATLSGTINAAWGAPFDDGFPSEYSSLNDVTGGFTNYDALSLSYGTTATEFVDSYQLFDVVLAPGFSLDGNMVANGVVQSGSTTDYIYIDVAADYLWLDVLPGTTELNTTIVWSNKSLSDFFTAGVPSLTDYTTPSNDLLLTLEIGEFAPEPIPEPGTWAAAALLVGGAAFARWRRRQTA